MSSGSFVGPYLRHVADFSAGNPISGRIGRIFENDDFAGVDAKSAEYAAKERRLSASARSEETVSKRRIGRRKGVVTPSSYIAP